MPSQLEMTLWAARRPLVVAGRSYLIGSISKLQASVVWDAPRGVFGLRATRRQDYHRAVKQRRSIIVLTIGVLLSFVGFGAAATVAGREDSLYAPWGLDCIDGDLVDETEFLISPSKSGGFKTPELAVAAQLSRSAPSLLEPDVTMSTAIEGSEGVHVFEFSPSEDRVARFAANSFGGSWYVIGYAKCSSIKAGESGD